MSVINKNKVIVVVDAYSTGRFLPKEILLRGFNCVHVISRANLPDYITTHNEDNKFLQEILYKNSLEKLLLELGHFDVQAVMVGSETGVELTELLAKSLGLPGNDPNTSHLRRNKFYMVESLKKAGLLTARQFKTNNIKDLLNWYKEHFEEGKTVVIKPLHSAGTDHVTFCSNPMEIENAARGILGQVNKLGLLNDFVLAQSLLQGEEFVVNTVTLNGKHHLTDIWNCQKQRVEGAGVVAGCEVLLEASGDVQTALKEYAFRALDILGFTQGPAHFEIIFTSEGPALVEVGARIQGGVNPNVHMECMGTSQLIKSVDTYVNPERFLTYYPYDYSLKKYSRWADLIVPESGFIKSFTLIEKAKKLKSFYSSNVNINEGEFLPKTVDLFTSPGSIYLVNEDVSCLAQDYIVLRQMEKDSYQFTKSSDHK